MSHTSQNRIPVRDLTYIAFCTTLIVLCAWIRIPFIVPFTLQSFGIFLSVAVLGGRRACASVLLYLLLGAIGLPVFSGFSGGIGILLSSTGGYLFGFLIPPLFAWLSTNSNMKHKVLLSLLFGQLLCYTFGTIWYICLYVTSYNTASLVSVLSICVFPFILPDALKLIFALTLAKKLKKYIKQ